MRSFVAGAALLICFTVSQAAVAAPMDFELQTAVFANGSTLTGTITIDTATGMVTGVNLMTSNPAALYDFLDPSQGTFEDYYLFTAWTAAASATIPRVHFNLDTPTLVSYPGGALCFSDNCPISGGSTIHTVLQLDSGVEVAQSGQLVPVPEPGSAAMLGASAFLLAAVLRRRKPRQAVAPTSEGATH